MPIPDESIVYVDGIGRPQLSDQITPSIVLLFVQRGQIAIHELSRFVDSRIELVVKSNPVTAIENEEAEAAGFHFLIRHSNHQKVEPNDVVVIAAEGGLENIFAVTEPLL